jgi:hypothetical protein
VIQGYLASYGHVRPGLLMFLSTCPYSRVLVALLRHRFPARHSASIMCTHAAVRAHTGAQDESKKAPPRRKKTGEGNLHASINLPSGDSSKKTGFVNAKEIVYSYNIYVVLDQLARYEDEKDRLSQVRRAFPLLLCLHRTHARHVRRTANSTHMHTCHHPWTHAKSMGPCPRPLAYCLSSG